MRILMICSGNICRSPMAAALLRAEAERRGITGIEIASAGTWGQDGSPATDPATQVMRGRGIDITEHVARTVREPALDAADLVIVMTSVHGREIENLSRAAGAKVRLLRELAELEADKPPAEATPEQRLAALLAATRPSWRRALDLDDPYGMPLNVYERTASDIEEAIRHLAGSLFGEAP